MEKLTSDTIVMSASDENPHLHYESMMLLEQHRHQSKRLFIFSELPSSTISLLLSATRSTNLILKIEWSRKVHLTDGHTSFFVTEVDSVLRRLLMAFLSETSSRFLAR